MTDAIDPFDPAKLRLSQDFSASAGVRKLINTVPVRKPSKEWFVQAHPDYRLETSVLELKEDNEIYLVAPALRESLVGEATIGPRLLVTAMNRQNVLFLWPIRLPGIDGKIDAWSESSLDASKRAIGKWIRVSANMSLGAYEICEATGSLSEPQWPTLPFAEILRIAFKDRLYIDTIDHPVLKKLRGEA